MTTTLYATWTQLFNEFFENAYDPDPYNDLELNDEQREEFLTECRDHLLDEANKILAPYNAYMIGNGEILVNAGEEYVDLNLTERLGMIDFDCILAKYF